MCVHTSVLQAGCVSISRLRPDSLPSQPANRLVYLGALVTELAGSCCDSCSCEAAPGDSWLFTPHPAPPSCRRWYLCSALCKPSPPLHHHHQLAVYLKTLYIFISLIYKDDPLGDVVDNLVFSYLKSIEILQHHSSSLQIHICTVYRLMKIFNG